ncbi:MAG TPA: hypothetical protein VFB76_16380 [Candidatus Angelobacter sp.]|nr:hypothetical protein [Candidatus Angelobacter sp.]
MGTVSSVLLFFATTFQQPRFHPGFYQSFSTLHKYKPLTHPCLGVFLNHAHTSVSRAIHPNKTYISRIDSLLRARLHKAAIAPPQSICKTFIHATLQGSSAASHVEQPSPDFFSTHDAQPSCPTCGLPANASCPSCEDKFCRSHIYQCRECQISFCGDCLDLHSLDGHWSDSDTARAMVNSIHRRSSPSQPMHEQSPARHTQREFTSGGFTNNSYASNRFTSSEFISNEFQSTSSLSPTQRTSPPCSRRSTIPALLAHPTRLLFAIFAPFSPEAAQ